MDSSSLTVSEAEHFLNNIVKGNVTQSQYQAFLEQFNKMKWKDKQHIFHTAQSLLENCFNSAGSVDPNIHKNRVSLLARIPPPDMSSAAGIIFKCFSVPLTLTGRTLP